MRRIYSPRIAPGLIPALYHTARDRGVPMTRLVNGLLYRGLACEHLPETARAVFPGSAEALRVGGIEMEQGAGWIGPEARARSPAVNPFESVEAVDAWKDSALSGIVRAAETARKSVGFEGYRSIDWLYRSAELAVGRVAADVVDRLQPVPAGRVAEARGKQDRS